MHLLYFYLRNYHFAYCIKTVPVFQKCYCIKIIFVHKHMYILYHYANFRFVKFRIVIRENSFARPHGGLNFKFINTYR